MPRLIATLLLALLSACSPIDFGEQEVFLAHDAQADKLRMLIVYDSIQAVPRDREDGVAEGRKFADSVSGGKRSFMVYGWPFCVDLDEDHDHEADADEHTREWRAVGDGVRVVRAGYCNGEFKRPSLFQSIEIEHAAHVVELLDRELIDALAEEIAAGDFDSSTPWMDARTREAWKAMTREKRRWLSLKDGALTADLPMTDKSAAALLAMASEHTAEDAEGARFLASLLSHLTELRIADEHVVLRWKLDGPILTFRKPKNQPYSDHLEESLRASKVLPESLPSREKVTADWRGH